MTECIRILQCANAVLAWPFRLLETDDEQIRDLSLWTLSVVSWWLAATPEGLCWGFPHFLVGLKVSIPELFGRSVWNIILWNPKTPLWIQIWCARQETCEGGEGRELGWEQVAWWEVGGRCCCTAAGGSCWESREGQAAAPADLLFVYLAPGDPCNSLNSSDTYPLISDLGLTCQPRR